MKNNEMKKIPLKLNKIIKNNCLIHTIEKTATRGSSKNLIINPAALNPVKAGKKRKELVLQTKFNLKKILRKLYILMIKFHLRTIKQILGKIYFLNNIKNNVQILMK